MRRSRDNDGDDEADQVRALESQIAGHNKDLDQLKKKTGAIEQAIKALQDKILEVGGVRLRTQQAKVQDLKEVIDHANDRLTKAEVAKSKAERDVVKLEKALGKNRGDLDGLEAEVEELEEKMGSNEAEAEAMRQGAEQARFALEEQKESLDAIAEQLAERMKVINEFKARQVRVVGPAGVAADVGAGGAQAPDGRVEADPAAGQEDARLLVCQAREPEAARDHGRVRRQSFTPTLADVWQRRRRGRKGRRGDRAAGVHCRRL